MFALNGPREGQVVETRTYCRDEPDPTIVGLEQDIAVVTPERFQEFPILASSVVSQPDGFSLRNGHAHLYAESETQTFSVTIFDQDVRVRAIPTTWVWDYGDGETVRRDFAGAPMPDHDLAVETPSSHVYTETGDFQVRLTTLYRGEYSTEGGPWTPIPGVAGVPSDPLTMSVWRTRKLMVAEDCTANPDGPGCASPFVGDDE
ncbi:hypothetical protein ACQ3I4_01580 [Zafaria sp. Z1313]|uniref:hypothetical protein n=1 Tax=Zafaria sp. Z1313 TaxID=3423202 RepID=UPI003D3020D2